VLGALVNAVFLVALCFSILVEAFKRLVEPEGLHDPDLILIVGGIGLLINVIGMFLFHGENIMLYITYTGVRKKHTFEICFFVECFL